MAKRKIFIIFTDGPPNNVNKLYILNSPREFETWIENGVIQDVDFKHDSIYLMFNNKPPLIDTANQTGLNQDRIYILNSPREFETWIENGVIQETDYSIDSLYLMSNSKNPIIDNSNQTGENQDRLYTSSNLIEILYLDNSYSSLDGIEIVDELSSLDHRLEI